MLKSLIFPNLLILRLFAPLLFVGVFTGCACTDTHKPEASKRDNDRNKEIAALGTFSPRKTEIREAFADIKSFKGDQIKGKITFTKVPEGIKIVADVDGLTPGRHGFHVHEFGNCSDDGAATGSHFNPTNKKHGGPDSPERHVGDLGNLVANDKGHAHYERVDKIIALEGENSILGRSIVVHADPDDYTTQPTGASGNKIACGIIKPVENR